MSGRVPFAELARETRDIRDRIRAAVDRVLDRGRFILGPELLAFEQEFQSWLNSGPVVGLSSGTDAIAIALLAVGIEQGDEVITVANTCAPTANGIALVGARLRLVDCDPDTLMISPEQVDAAMTRATRAIVPVHLYGSAADVGTIAVIAERRSAFVIEDCAQAIGTKLVDGYAGTLGHAAAFSFYPTKNLGAYGDAGAAVFRSAAHAKRAASLRHHGQRERDVAEEPGFNARLDELQAAVLREKLTLVEGWNRRRSEIARYYTERFAEAEVVLPGIPPYLVEHTYHLYVIQVQARDAFRRRLGARGVETLVHYPVPLHLQPAFAGLGHRRGDFPNAERACDQILSLPMHPYLSDGEVEFVADAVLSAL